MMGEAYTFRSHAFMEEASTIYSDQTETFQSKRTRSESLGGSKRTVKN